MSSRWSILFGVLGGTLTLQAQDLLPVPVGLDAYRQWEKWPQQRIGARAYMRSTYDRRGGNESADASHFLYQLADDYNVTLDVEGPGILYFARYNHWHGSPWHYVVDGTDYLVQESTTPNPNQRVPGSVFIPEAAFPNPLTWTWSTTKGADLMWVPIGFERSFRMAYSRTHYGTGYYIYHQFVNGIPLSQPIRAWSTNQAPDPAVLALINRAGTDLVPQPDSPDGRALGIVEHRGSTSVPAKQAVTLLSLDQGPAMLRALEFDVPTEHVLNFGRARLRITWDNRARPSIEAPVALFFGAGTLYNRDNREYLVKGFPMFIRYEKERVRLACFYPMPFFSSAKVELVGGDQAVPGVRWFVRTSRNPYQLHQCGYFHATYRDHPNPVPGHDLVCLDTRETEGGGDWSGQLVGMSWIFSDRAVLNTLEGDPRFFFDDSQTPQAYGTGTEEWGGGGDYWGGLNMTLPFAGHPVGARNAKEAKNDEDKIESAYRFLLADLMPFGKNAVIRLEHGGENQSTEHYRTVVYWYGNPNPALVQTDRLKIGDAASEAAHGYVSPQASAPYSITSRHEWGVDSIRGSASSTENKPLANPTDFAEFEFEASANTTYTIWVRGQNLDGQNTSDASWLQFDDDIGTDKLGASHNHPKGFGNWLDRFPAKTYAWSSALPQDPPQTISFARPGKHRLRVQPRHPGHILDQIWLSPTQKELPKSGLRKTAPEGEIVLSANDATKVAGRIKRIGDSTDKGLTVFEIGRTALPSNVEVYPAHTDVGRKTTGTSEFNLNLVPDNQGVLLRRKLDYQFPNQRAEVQVAVLDDGQPGPWRLAGVWYLAGANTCVYSNPREELGATLHIAQTSNRQFRDDEFLIPRDLTRGRSQIRVRVVFTPVRIPLFPGHPMPEVAWSEIQYTAYCYVLPKGDARPAGLRK